MYDWDVKEISSLIKEYRKLYKCELDENEKEEYLGTLYSLRELKDYYKSIINKTGGFRVSSFYSLQKHSSIKDTVFNDLRILESYGMYTTFLREFTSLIDFRDVPYQDELRRIGTIETDIVNLTSSFYKGMSRDFYEPYRELASNFRTRLKFIHSKNLYDYTGNTHPVYGTSRVYIDVVRNNSFQDYVSLLHESSHGITSLVNQDIMLDFSKYCFIEVDSIFFELIGTEYVGSKLNKEEDAKRIRLAIFRDYLYNAYILCLKMDMYSILNEKEYSKKKHVRTYLMDLGLDKEEIDDVVNTSMQDYLHYIISYLVAIELYMIYIVDKDYALSILYKIINMRNMGTTEYLEEIKKLGIIPGKYVMDYYGIIIEGSGVKYGKKI